MVCADVGSVLVRSPPSDTHPVMPVYAVLVGNLIFYLPLESEETLALVPSLPFQNSMLTDLCPQQ